MSLNLGLGTLQKPGAGFIPFCSALCLGVLSLLVLLFVRGKKDDVIEKTDWKRVILVLFSLFCYIILLDYLGFLVSTILFIGVIMRNAEKKGWIKVVFTSLCMSMCSYMIFKLWLKAELPKGLFGF